MKLFAIAAVAASALLATSAFAHSPTVTVVAGGGAFGNASAGTWGPGVAGSAAGGIVAQGAAQQGGSTVGGAVAAGGGVAGAAGFGVHTQASGGAFLVGGTQIGH